MRDSNPFTDLTYQTNKRTVLTGISAALTASISGCLNGSDDGSSNNTPSGDAEPLPNDVEPTPGDDTNTNNNNDNTADGEESTTEQGRADFSLMYTDGDLVASHSSDTEIRRFTVTNVNGDVVTSTSVTPEDTQTVLVENIAERLDPYNSTRNELPINDFTVAGVNSAGEELGVKETEYVISDVELRGTEVQQDVFTYKFYNPNDAFIQYTYGVFTTPERVIPKAAITDSESQDAVYRTSQPLPLVKHDSNTFVLNDDEEVVLSRELDDPHTLGDSNDIGYSDPVNTGESLNSNRVTIGFTVSDLTVKEQIYVSDEDVLSPPSDVDEGIEIQTIVVLNFQASGEMQIPVTLKVPGYKTRIDATSGSEDNMQQYTITYTPKSIEWASEYEE